MARNRADNINLKITISSIGIPPSVDDFVRVFFVGLRNVAGVLFIKPNVCCAVRYFDFSCI